MTYWNYTTQQDELMPTAITYEVGQSLIPQKHAALRLYTCLVEMGKLPVEAVIEVLQTLTEKQQKAA